MKIRILLATVFFLPSLFLHGAFLVNDSFDYTAGEQLDDENPAWTPDPGSGGGTGITVVTPAFGSSVSPFPQTGNSIQLTSGRNTHIDITTVADTDYYFSYLVKPGTFGGSSGQWHGVFFENGSSDLFAGFDQNGNFITQAHTSPVDSGIDGVTGTEYFVLGKVSFGNDTKTFDISASVFTASGDVPATEPVTWNSTDTFTYGVSQSSLSEFRFQARGGISQFDDARVATTYAEVAIPEPSSIALMGLAFGALALLRRRMS